MELMRVGGIIKSIMLISVIVFLVLVFSIDLYSAVYYGVIGIVILGLVVGFIGAIKILPHIESHGENNNKKAAESLAKDIDKSQKTIKIVGGSANPEVYNSDQVVNAFKKAIHRDVKIKAVFSEISSKEENIILELAQKGEIELYTPRRNSVPRNHFRVVDTKLVYSEKGHKDKEEMRYFQRFDNIRNMAVKFEEAFDNIINNSVKYT